MTTAGVPPARPARRRPDRRSGSACQARRARPRPGWRGFLTEIEHEFAIEKFTLAELEEKEAELDKLQRWHERIEARDIHGAPGAEQAEEALARAQEALDRYSSAVFERTQL
ncbi:MAG: hypothetical protein M3O90_09725 [Actinomycetota bacterium]|nr:hypothetical protein [Actinomycetota bacterium]